MPVKLAPDMLTELTPEQAAQLAVIYEGKCLHLNGLTTLSDEVAHALATHEGPLVRNGLATLSDGQQRDQVCSSTLKRSTTTSEFIRPWATKPPTNSKPKTPRFPN